MSKTNLRAKPPNTNFPMKGSPTYIDRLPEDPPIPGRHFVTVSFISPHGLRNTSLHGFKVHNVYDTYEDAKKDSEIIRERDGNKFDVYVGDLGKWLPYNPDRNSVKDQVYVESELNDLMHAHQQHAEKTKMIHNERLQGIKQQMNDPHRSGERKKKLQDDILKKKEMKKTATELPKKISSLSSNVDIEEKHMELKHKQEELKKSTDVLEKKSESIAKQMETVEQLQTTRQEINELYKSTTGHDVPLTQDAIDIMKYCEVFKEENVKKI